MLLYDNLKDAQDKLLGTICMYKGRACLVREVIPHNPDNTPPFGLTLAFRNTRSLTRTTTDDKDFDFRHFKLGYAHHSGVIAWWYRKPVKQYKQGLRQDQVKAVLSKPEHYRGIAWDWSQDIVDMLENSYPSLGTCQKMLMDGENSAMAFNRDFGLSYDKIHKDYIFEHRGRLVGQTSNFKNFTLLEEFKYLNESLKEILNVA